MKKLVKILSVLLSVLLLAQFAAVGANARTDPPELSDFLEALGLPTAEVATMKSLIDDLYINEANLVDFMEEELNYPGDADEYVDFVFNDQETQTLLCEIGGYVATRYSVTDLDPGLGTYCIAFYTYFIEKASVIRGYFATELVLAPDSYALDPLVEGVMNFYFWLLTESDLNVLLSKIVAPLWPEDYDSVWLPLYLEALGLDPATVAALVSPILALEIGNKANLQESMETFLSGNPLELSYVPNYVGAIFSVQKTLLRDIGGYLVAFFTIGEIAGMLGGDIASVAFYNHFTEIVKELREIIAGAFDLNLLDPNDQEEIDGGAACIMQFYFYLMSGNPVTISADMAELFPQP